MPSKIFIAKQDAFQDLVSLLTSSFLNSAICIEINCRGITVIKPCRQSTVWGTSRHLLTIALVSSSPDSQSTMGFPYCIPRVKCDKSCMTMIELLILVEMVKN
ncbi:unnamed protein product [Owenia fusiformis]|uniref:Uncharacterized protein n=1 Tax=Owenia fusiformis TaxID=6347 RepID=A0A8J1U6N5_OWEFU|nr:unnamed protein product [Owenia fusiformis]